MAAKKILVGINLTKNEIQNAVAHVLAADPSSPAEGQFYYDSVNKRWKYMTDVAFVSDLDRSRHFGTQLASSISNFDTAVRNNSLDQLAAPGADVSMNSHKITNVATPTNGTDAANKNYVDNVVAAISWKDEVRVATTANGTLSTAYVNGQTVDGVTLVTGDRILLKNQTTQSENGIYTVNASGSPTRAPDADSAAEIAGAAVYVSNGTTNGGTRWLNNNTGAITIGSSAITFVAFGGGGSYTNGDGLSLTGSTFAVVADTGIAVTSSGVKIDTAVVPRKYTQTIGDGSATSIVVTHSLGNQWVIAQVCDATSGADVECDVVRNSTTQTTFNFTTAPTSGQFRVIILG